MLKFCACELLVRQVIFHVGHFSKTWQSDSDRGGLETTWFTLARANFIDRSTSGLIGEEGETVAGR